MAASITFFAYCRPSKGLGRETGIIKAIASIPLVISSILSASFKFAKIGVAPACFNFSKLFSELVAAITIAPFFFASAIT
ncbi:hypothetical protein D3C80_1857770 [compost metagenome]